MELIFLTFHQQGLARDFAITVHDANGTEVHSSTHLAALGAAFTDDEVMAAYGLAARLGKRHEMPGLTAALTTTSAGPGAARLHARSALAARHARAGRTQAARAAYRAVARHADGPLALRAHRALLSLAVEVGDEAEALDALGDFLAAEPTDAQLAEAAGRVLAAFPDAALAEVRATPPAFDRTGDEASLPTALLASPRPNPTDGRAEVRFALAEGADVRLAVFDALGREVAVLARGAHAEGPHTASLDAGTLAPGVYLVRLAAGDAAATTRLTVVR